MSNTENKAEILKLISKKLSQINDSTEIENFFHAFFTPKECENLCDRHELIKMLLNKTPQREISKNLQVSISQISRGSAELQFGAGKEFFPKFFK